MSFKLKELREIAIFNPSEKLDEGAFVKKIPMANLKEFTRKIDGYELANYKSGPKFRNHDTLVAKITPCLENGKTAYVDILDSDEVAYGSSEFIVLRAKDNTDPQFLYYLARSPLFRKKAISCMEGTSGRQRVNENTLKLYEVPIPDKNEQTKIANVLTLLDKKIEINQNICIELEQFARLYFDYWFIDFNFPNAINKPYKFSNGAMINDHILKREIPAGWNVKTLSEIANITMGQSPDGSSYNKSAQGTIFYQGSTDFGWIFPKVRHYTTEPARMAKKGNILLSVRAPVGDINIANTDCCIGRGLAAINSKDGFDGFLFYVMKYFKQVFDRRNSEGTTFGSITKNDLYSLKLAYPPKELLEKYDNIVSKYNKMIFIRSMENQKLEELRDWLLPMLMNGQISIRNAEEHIARTFEQNE